MAYSFLYFLISCSEATAPVVIEIENEIINEEIPSSELKYLALGDSYTIGQGVSTSSRWPIQLQERLEEDEIIIDSVKIIAQTGWTTTNLLTAMNEEELAEFDMVSLLIGVNNQFQGKDFSIYEEEVLTLLDRAASICKSENEGIFVVSIPDYGVTPFGLNNAEQIGEELDQYNAYMKAVCEEREIPFIDITELSRNLGSENGALAEDNLHPSGLQYSKWVALIEPIVKELINR